MQSASPPIALFPASNATGNELVLPASLSTKALLPPSAKSQHCVAFCTLGCKANQLESASLANQFKGRGWSVVDFEEPATLYVFNTCTVTERSDAEARRLIRQVKRRQPEAWIAVTGCYAQVSPEALSNIEGVNFVVGNGLKDDLLKIIEERIETDPIENWDQTPWIRVDEFEKSRILENAIGSESGIDRTRGSLKIQDGCDYKCTYCIIWKARGPSRSVSVHQAKQQLERLLTEGFKEIVLTGINIGQYQETDQTLPTLLHELCQIPGEFRLRLTSLDPLEVSSELIDVIAASNGKIAPHLHLSTQSADDDVLKRMARRHHVHQLEEICDTLVRKIPNMAIGSDIIVGFPGETDIAFENTFSVLSRIPMHYMHVFRYSPRPGTPAVDFKPIVPDALRKERAQRLTELSSKKNRVFRQQFLGETLQVLVEKVNLQEKVAEGLAENYLRVRIPLEIGNSPNTTDPLATVFENQFVTARIVSIMAEGYPDCLEGQLVHTPILQTNGVLSV